MSPSKLEEDIWYPHILKGVKIRCLLHLIEMCSSLWPQKSRLHWSYCPKNFVWMADFHALSSGMAKEILRGSCNFQCSSCRVESLMNHHRINSRICPTRSIYHRGERRTKEIGELLMVASKTRDDRISDVLCLGELLKDVDSLSRTTLISRSQRWRRILERGSSNRTWSKTQQSEESVSLWSR